MRYMLGNGLAKDEASAMEWFIKAAEQGDADACLHLGCMHKHGIGGAKDEARAAEFEMKGIGKGARAGGSFLSVFVGQWVLDGRGRIVCQE